LRLTEDDGEDIFEIVGGARSQAANGFHFLRLPQLFLLLLQGQMIATLVPADSPSFNQALKTDWSDRQRNVD
jgi:hypothetical protein